MRKAVQGQPWTRAVAQDQLVRAETKGPKGGADKNSKSGMSRDKTSWPTTRSRR